MDSVKYDQKNGTLILALRGKIDSSNAPKVEAEINDIRAENPSDAVLVDCEELTYISSAGLRVLLRLKKAVPDTRLENVSADTYEIFEVTGFTEMMEIQKAYRRISVEGCEVIGQGANGKIYRIDPETIVKVFLNPDALPEIRRERELARTAFVLGVPTAIPYDVVRIEGGGYGSVFELLNADTLAKLMSRGEVTVDQAAEMSMELLRLIHSTEVKPDSMPDMKAVALGWADFLRDYLPAGLHRKLHDLVAAVPEDNHMLHGDFHLKNVMLQNGECLLIDMDTLCHGHPIFELASMFNAYLGFSELDHSVIEAFQGIPHETAVEFWRKALRLYLGTDDDATVKAVENKAAILGYSRIMRRRIRRNGFDTEEGRREIENCRRRLAELLPETDTLLF